MSALRDRHNKPSERHPAHWKHYDMSRLWSIPIFSVINFFKIWKLFEKETCNLPATFKGFRNIATFEGTVILKHLQHSILKVLNLQHSKDLHDRNLFKKISENLFDILLVLTLNDKWKTANQCINIPFLQSFWHLLHSLLTLSLWGH